MDKKTWEVQRALDAAVFRALLHVNSEVENVEAIKKLLGRAEAGLSLAQRSFDEQKQVADTYKAELEAQEAGSGDIA